MRDLRVGDIPVASYVASPDLDIRLAPRPYLHPVRTLGGVVVTDALCFDHPWHLGASLTLADVNGVNIWGGRTYVRDRGYEWLPDHGRIRHDAWLAPDHNSADSGFAERLTWCDGAGREILREHRSVSAGAAQYGWELRFSYTLTPVGESSVVLGSPATHGRPGGAGYGGFFWRAGPGVARASGENGSDEPWVALTVGGAYTLVFRGLTGDDRWFVRTDEYAGVCAALAYEHELSVPPGGSLRRDLRVLVADGVLEPEQISDR